MPHVAPYARRHSETSQTFSRQLVPDKLLVMDDDDDLRQLLDISLTHLGYQVVCVRDGEAAIEAYESARALGDPFRVLVFDLQIKGGMGGEATLAHLQERDPQIKAIVCSAADHDPVMQYYEAYGFAAKLEKPFRRAELQALLKRIIETPSQSSLS